MRAEEFIQAGRELFGEPWQGKMAKALDISRTTRWRYCTGWKIPKRVELAVLRLLDEKRKSRQ